MADTNNQQFCLRWNNHTSTLVSVFDTLLESGTLVDCTLAAEGQYLKAHKVVLCACSPYLELLLSQHYEKHPIVILKDVKFQELKSMMDYMYKGEVNISQEQLATFLKAAESLQIKGLTDGSGGDDSRDVGSTTAMVRHEHSRTATRSQPRSPAVLPSHPSGLTVEPVNNRRSVASHLSDSQPESPIRSREGSISPTMRKRRKRRASDDDSHGGSTAGDLDMGSMHHSVASGSSSSSASVLTKHQQPPDDDGDHSMGSDSLNRLSTLAESGLLKEKIEPQNEMMLEPKTEYLDETNNDDSVEDLTLDDDDDYDGMDAAGPSHGGDNSNQGYAQWQMSGERNQDEVFMAAQEAVSAHRDSQVRILFEPCCSPQPKSAEEIWNFAYQSPRVIIAGRKDINQTTVTPSRGLKRKHTRDLKSREEQHIEPEAAELNSKSDTDGEGLLNVVYNLSTKVDKNMECTKNMLTDLSTTVTKLAHGQKSMNAMLRKIMQYKLNMDPVSSSASSTFASSLQTPVFDQPCYGDLQLPLTNDISIEQFDAELIQNPNIKHAFWKFLEIQLNIRKSQPRQLVIRDVLDLIYTDGILYEYSLAGRTEPPTKELRKTNALLIAKECIQSTLKYAPSQVNSALGQWMKNKRDVWLRYHKGGGRDSRDKRREARAKVMKLENVSNLSTTVQTSANNVLKADASRLRSSKRQDSEDSDSSSSSSSAS